MILGGLSALSSMNYREWLQRVVKSDTLAANKG